MNKIVILTNEFFFFFFWDYDQWIKTVITREVLQKNIRLWIKMGIN